MPKAQTHHHILKSVVLPELVVTEVAARGTAAGAGPKYLRSLW